VFGELQSRVLLSPEWLVFCLYPHVPILLTEGYHVGLTYNTKHLYGVRGMRLQSLKAHEAYLGNLRAPPQRNQYQYLTLSHTTPLGRGQAFSALPKLSG